MLLYLLGVRGRGGVSQCNLVILGVVFDEGKTDYFNVSEGLLGETRRAEEWVITTFLRVCLEILDMLMNGLSRRSLRFCLEGFARRFLTS